MELLFNEPTLAPRVVITLRASSFTVCAAIRVHQFDGVLRNTDFAFCAKWLLFHTAASGLECPNVSGAVQFIAEFTKLRVACSVS